MKISYNKIALPVLLVSLASAAHAAVVFDSFLTGGVAASGQYNTGALIGQNPTLSGFSGAWATPSSATVTVGASSLAFSNSSGSVNTAGGAVTVTTGRVMRDLGTVLNVQPTTPYTRYVSFLLQNSVSGDSAAYRAVEFFQAGSTNQGTRTFQLGLSNTDFGTLNYGFRLSNSDALRGNLGSANTGVNLFVVRFDFANGNDTVTVWMNPSNLGSEAGAGAGVSVSGALLTSNIGRVSLASFGGTASTMGLDELRIGDTWSEVVNFTAAPIPEPSSFAALAGCAAVGCAMLRRRRRAG